jgi:hypothetical protein
MIVSLSLLRVPSTFLTLIGTRKGNFRRSAQMKTEATFDEKSQCQALQRSQPGLPLGQGISGRSLTITTDMER